MDGGSTLNPPINPKLPQNKSKKYVRLFILSISAGDLVVPINHFSDPTKGLRYAPPGEGIPSQLILVPRSEALTRASTKACRNMSLCNALEAVEANMHSSEERGVKHVMREGSHKY